MRLIVSTVLSIILVWLLATFLPDVFVLDGGVRAWIIVGALLTLMNILVRPLLNLFTLPLKLFATILAVILVNGVFLYLVIKITDLMDPSIVSLRIQGGVGGWLTLTLIVGLAHWVMKEILRHRG